MNARIAWSCTAGLLAIGTTYIARPALAAEQTAGYTIVIDSPTAFTDKDCLRTPSVRLRGHVAVPTERAGSAAGQARLFIIGIIKTNKYWFQSYQRMEPSSGVARWSLAIQLGEARHKGISGQLSLFVVTEEERMKAARGYTNGADEEPEDVFSWKDAPLRDVSMERCP